MPPLPSSGTTGRLKAPTTQLPPNKAAGTGKIVVMLSSVAKPAPANSQSMPGVPLPSAVPQVTGPPDVPPPGPAAQAASPPKVDPISQRAVTPPALPPKQVAPATPPPPPPRLSATTFVKLPPKTANPSLVTLTGNPTVPTPVPVAMPDATSVPQPVEKAKAPTPIAPAPPLSASLAPLGKASPPPLPSKRLTQAISRKTGVHLIPPIKLNELSGEPVSAEDSIFAPANTAPTAKPTGWKNLEPGELPLPAGKLKDLEVFERAQKLGDKPAATTPVTPQTRPTAPTVTAPMVRPPQGPIQPLPAPSPQPAAKDPASPPALPPAKAAAPIEAKEKEAHAPNTAPPLRPPARTETPPESKATTLNPPPLTPSPARKTEPPPLPPVHVAPPMVTKSDEPAAEKLPPPLFPPEGKKDATPAVAAESTALHKAPPLAQPEPTPAKALSPSAASLTKTASEWLKKTTSLAPPAATPKPPPMPIAEAKPALKAPVLPKRSLLKEAETQALPPATVVSPVVIETKPAAKKIDPPLPPKTDHPSTASSAAPLVPLAKVVTAAGVAGAVTATTPSPKSTSSISAKLPGKDKASTQPIDPAKTAPPTVPAKAPLPKTRAERAKKRRLIETVIFWAALVPLTIAGLVFGSFYFGRETLVEGQVIPPHGMAVSNEVWIVNDFSSLASGIAEDLAAERTPLQQEIQERQEHVQRAQADVASREERIRLIQEQIASAKDEIGAIVKKSRDETQKLWDGEGAAIDNEYESRMAQLKDAIAARAKSLHLNYAPDENFQSPEVWANAYRLALYETPPGVDGTKEHQWLSDQMKQWRDLQKSLDDRKEQLREEAAQKKLEPAPQISDLNAKIDELQQRADSTATEEVPLKAELEQAQADLALAQAADANLDEKYYKQLYSLPEGSIVNHRRFPVSPEGRFTWAEDEPFVEGESQHRYWIFARAIRSDGRQYWSFHHFSIAKNQTVELLFEPSGFVSTKAILRPNLPPEDQEE